MQLLALKLHWSCWNIFCRCSQIYDGKTDRSIRNISRLSSSTSLGLSIAIRWNQSISPDAPNLLIIEIFRGQRISKVTELNEENILITCVPNNMLIYFLALGFDCQFKWKRFHAVKIGTWYAQKIKEGMVGESRLTILLFRRPLLTAIKPL